MTFNEWVKKDDKAVMIAFLWIRLLRQSHLKYDVMATKYKHAPTTPSYQTPHYPVKDETPPRR